jgi:dsDNA-binding SOS-regulon protein
MEEEKREDMRVHLAENTHKRNSYDDARNPAPKDGSENRAKRAKRI